MSIGTPATVSWSCGVPPNVESLFRSRLVCQFRAVAPVPVARLTATRTCVATAVAKPPRCRVALSSVPLTASQRRGSVVLVGVIAAIAIEPPSIVTPKVAVPTARLRFERPNVSSVASTGGLCVTWIVWRVSSKCADPETRPAMSRFTRSPATNVWSVVRLIGVETTESWSAGLAPKAVSLLRSRLVVQLRTVAPAPEKRLMRTSTFWSVAVSRPPRLSEAPSPTPRIASQRRRSVFSVGVIAAIAIEPPLIVTPNVSVPTFRLRFESPKVSRVASVEPPWLTWIVCLVTSKCADPETRLAMFRLVRSPATNTWSVVRLIGVRTTES